MEALLKAVNLDGASQVVKFVMIGALKMSTILVEEVLGRLTQKLRQLGIYFDSRIMEGRGQEEITYLQKGINELLCHRIDSFL